MFKVFFKKFFGPKYHMFLVSVFTMTLMYILKSKIGFIIDFDTFLLSNMILTVILTYQTLTSQDNLESFKRLFTYPLNKNEFKIKYILSILFYSFTTRNLLLYIIYTNSFILKDFIIFVLSFISISLLSISIFLLHNKKNKYNKFLIFLEFMFYIICENTNILIISYIINIIFSILIIMKSDIITFLYISKVKMKNIKSLHVSFFTYIKRYFVFNKSYILSFLSMFILVFSFTYINKNIDVLYIPYIFVILIYNTPLSIVVSVNKSLQKKIKSYPKQINLFFIPYFIFVLLIDLFVTTLFLLTSKFSYSLPILLIQLIFCFENALFTILFEYKLPITKWNTETELWNNPRKYIITSILLFEASICAYFLK